MVVVAQIFFLGCFIAGLVMFLVSIVVLCYRGLIGEAGAGANGRPAPRVVTVAAPAPVEPRPATAVAPRPITATAPVVVKLGYFPYSADGNGRRSSENLVCAICLEVFQHEDACSEVPQCRHLFHRDCIHAWMKTCKTTCPLCRHRIVTWSERISAADDMV